MLLSISIYRFDIVDISNLIASAASLSVFSISSCPIYGRATQLSAAFATSMSVRPSLSSWHSWVTHKRFIISMYALHHSSLQYYYSNSSHIISTIKFRFFFSVLNSPWWSASAEVWYFWVCPSCANWFICFYLMTRVRHTACKCVTDVIGVRQQNSTQQPQHNAQKSTDVELSFVVCWLTLTDIC